MGTSDYSKVEQNTRSFLEDLRRNSGPPIYKLSPEQARNILSSIQAAPIEKPDADIEPQYSRGPYWRFIHPDLSASRYS